MSFQLNVLDCNQAVAGTGIKGCSTMIEAFQKIILTKKTWKANRTLDNFDQADVDTWIQNGDWVVLDKIFNTNATRDEPVLSSSPYTGEDSFVRHNPLKMILEFDRQSSCYLSALQTLSGGKYDALFIDYDKSGKSRIWGERTEDGLYFKGLDAGLVNGAGFIINNGTDSARPRLIVQLTLAGTIRLDNAMATPGSNVDFINLNGVVDVTIQAETLTASNFQVSVTTSCNGTEKIVGLNNVNSWLIKDSTGAVVTPTGITYANGIYTIVGLSAGSYTIQIYDVTNDYEIVVIDGEYFKSGTIAVTLV
jgi:hypothetical protein